jgi:hypothetical protein
MDRTRRRCGTRATRMYDDPAACSTTWLTSKVIPTSATTPIDKAVPQIDAAVCALLQTATVTAVRPTGGRP